MGYYGIPMAEYMVLTKWYLKSVGDMGNWPPFPPPYYQFPPSLFSLPLFSISLVGRLKFSHLSSFNCLPIGAKPLHQHPSLYPTPYIFVCISICLNHFWLWCVMTPPPPHQPPPPTPKPLQENILSLLVYYNDHLDNTTVWMPQRNSGWANDNYWSLVAFRFISVGLVMDMNMGVEG